MVIAVSLAQRMKASSPISVTEFGMVIAVSSMHSSKASSPILVTVYALPSLSYTVSGITISPLTELPAISELLSPDFVSQVLAVSVVYVSP
jgi:hypothetical protein